MVSLARVDALVLDLDGVVYRGDRVIPGVPGIVTQLRARGVALVFATNNAMDPPDHCAEKLGRMGIAAAPREIVTSADVLAEEIEQRGWAGRSAFLVGTEGLRETLQPSGLRFVTGGDARRAEVVIASGDPGFTYDKLRTAGLALHAGADLIATNADATFPATDGLWPGAGSVLAAIETVSGRRAEVMGKPHLPMMRTIGRRLGDRELVAMVGDQPKTDLDGARAMGWMTILVLSGVTGGAEAASLDPAPDLVLQSLAELQLAAPTES